MRQYVLGFFTQGNLVALIRKRRPAWQAGLLNGIGGRIEQGETPAEAMVREFREETGYVDVAAWRLFAVVENPVAGYVVHCYQAEGDVFALRSTTDEQVERHTATLLPPDVVSKVRWLLPLCYDRGLLAPVHVLHGDEEIGTGPDDERALPDSSTTAG